MIPRETAETNLNKRRVENVCDTVFAVVFALVALQLRVPDLPAQAGQYELFDRMLQMIPAFAGVLIVFAALAYYWFLHTLTFHYIHHTDRTLIWINLGLVLFLSGLPFSAALMARYPMQPLSQLFYFGNLLVIGVALNWHWHHAIRRIGVTADVMEQQRLSSQLRILPTALALTLVAAGLKPEVSFYVFVWAVVADRAAEVWRLRRRFRLPRNVVEQARPVVKD
jgi:uncharacterized membrane protein